MRGDDRMQVIALRHGIEPIPKGSAVFEEQQPTDGGHTKKACAANQPKNFALKAREVIVIH